MVGLFSQISLQASPVGVGEREFLGDVKSLLPPNYKHFLEDPVEEDPVAPPSQDQREVSLVVNENPLIDPPLKEEPQPFSKAQSELPLTQELSLEPTQPSLESLPLEPEPVSEERESTLPVAQEESPGLIETPISAEEENPFVSEDQGKGLNSEEENKPIGDNTAPAEEGGTAEEPGEKEEGLGLGAKEKLSVEKEMSVAESPLLVERVSPQSRRFDFGMVFFGLEGGIGMVNHDYRSSVGNGIDSQYSGYQGALGLRATWEPFLENNWTAGLTAAVRYYWGKIDTYHRTLTATGQTYEAETSQRYELAAKVGKWVGEIHPYVKLGPVLSHISLRTTDLNSTYTSATREWTWGGMLGGGLDVEVSKGLLLGGSVEYERYLMIKNRMFDATNSGRVYKITPSFVNLMLTLTWKLDRRFF